MAEINRDAPEAMRVWWKDLPDPRDSRAPDGAPTEIVFEYRTWQHVFDKHIRPGREPWAEILPADARLLRGGDTGSVCDSAVADAVEGLGRQVRDALERPLVLLYEVRRLASSGQSPGRKWTLVLPSGATAYVGESKAANRLVTCYFPVYAAVIKDRGFRWRRVVSHLVWQYGIVDTRRNALLLPTEHTVKLAPPRGAVKELHSGIRFVTPRSWGFCPELEGCPWRGRLTPWPATEAPGPRLRHRLKPRRRKFPDEEDPTL